MKKAIFLLILLILSLLVITGCKQAPEEPSPPSPPGMAQDGDIEDIFSDGEGILQKPKLCHSLCSFLDFRFF